MNILVTGGAGFIGSHVVQAYLDAGHHVTVLDNLCTGERSNIPAGVRFVEMDICDRSIGTFIERERFDVINHLAALISVPESFRMPIEYTTVNVTATVNLLDAAVRSGVQQFIFASTGVVYAEKEHMPYCEDDRTGPNTPYGASKLAAEQFVMMYAALHPAFHAVVLRYGNVFGPRQRVYGEGNLVAVCATKLLCGHQPTIFGDGSHTRDYIYVGDVVALNCQLLEHPLRGIFNVGTGRGRTVVEVCRAVADAVGTELKPYYGPPRTEPAHIVLSSTRLEQAIRWRPAVRFADAIARTVEWYRAQLSTTTGHNETPSEHTLGSSSGAGTTTPVGHQH